MAAVSPSYNDLIKKHVSASRHKTGAVLRFDGIGDKDIYNPSIIEDHGKLYIAARVESRNSDWMLEDQYDPQVIFFEKQQYGPWVPAKNAPVFGPMEDPHATWIHDENGKKKLIFGGVILERTSNPPTYITVFYKGDSIFTLEKEPFAQVRMMKDIRLVERIHKKEIIICTRPMINGFHTGRIGVTRIEKLSDLATVDLEQATLNLNQVAQGTWLGSNRLYLIEDKQTRKEKIGVLGHIATVDPDNMQHYAAMVFTFDADKAFDSEQADIIPRVIAVREDFEDAPAKLPTLKDVVFPAGLEHLDTGMVKLYTGLSDSRIGTILIPDPFHTERSA